MSGFRHPYILPFYLIHNHYVQERIYIFVSNAVNLSPTLFLDMQGFEGFIVQSSALSICILQEHMWQMPFTLIQTRQISIHLLFSLADSELLLQEKCNCDDFNLLVNTLSYSLHKANLS